MTKGTQEADANHYRIGVLGTDTVDADDVELGYGAPTLEYLEGNLQRWAVNVGAGEHVVLRVIVDNEVPPKPGVPDQATAVDIQVFDPVGATLVASLLTPLNSPGFVDLSFPNTSAVTKTYVVLVNADRHFKLVKQSGPDHGSYALDCPPQQTPPPTRVDIDIKPGSDPSCFNNDGHGTIPVAIFGSATFDVTRIIVDTVMLEGLAVKAVGKGNKLLAHIEDVDGDGFDDLVVKIEDTDGAFTAGDGTAVLTAELIPTSFGANQGVLVGVGDICVTQ